ncbi:MAG: TolC family protein [Pseudomonadota bacterium]
MIGTFFISAALLAQAVSPMAALPRPSGDPMAIDLDTDPIIAVERETSEISMFQALMAAALERHPAIDEAKAGADEAEAARDLARAGQLPSGDVSFSSARTLARDFSNDPNNIIERSRRKQRTDAIASIQQPLFDFGASALRTSAAKARINAAAARVDATTDEIGLRSVASWYDVFAFRALAQLGESFAADQAKLGEAVEARIAQGLSPRSDRARVTSFMASANSQRARIRRSLAGAEARFVELFGVAPPADLRRAPYPNLPSLSRDAAELRAANAAIVRAADADATAGQREAKAALADILPTITAGIDAGRYGVLETDNDYDIRARLTLRYRLFGGGDARAEQFAARARSGQARASRVREEARRDAAIAWADVNALTDQLGALRSSYVAGRQSRDTIAERFRIARGSLFDVLAAEQSYFETAASYLQAVTDLDTARYILLARTGGLADVLVVGGE